MMFLKSKYIYMHTKLLSTVKRDNELTVSQYRWIRGE